MAWRRIGDKPLSEPMLPRLTDAYMRHWGVKSISVRVYPRKYKHGFALLCCIYSILYVDSYDRMIYLPISFSVVSLALEQSHDCPSAIEVTLKYMGKIDWYQTTSIHILIAKLMGPRWVHLGPTGPRWVPCWRHMNLAIWATNANCVHYSLSAP